MVKKTSELAGRPPAAPEQVYADDGVDVSLIRWTMAMSPKERLATLQGAVDAILRMKNATQSPSRGTDRTFRSGR